MWPTPTPMPVQTPQFMPDIDAQQLGQDIAMGTIQGWNFFNSQSFSDVVWVILLLMTIVVGILSLKAHLESMDNG